MNQVRVKTVVLVLTDSRGRGLSEFLEQTAFKDDQSCEVLVSVVPGGKLPGLLDQASRYLTGECRVKGKTIDNVVVEAGICSLTTRRTITTEGQSRTELRYVRDVDNLIAIAESVISSYHQFPERINIATIVPASLKKYSEYHNGEALSSDATLKGEQDHLLEDIGKLNDIIIGENKELPNTQTIDLWRTVIKSSLKRVTKSPEDRERRRVQKFTEKNLHDGVHGNQWLQVKWFDRITQILANRFLYI